MVQGMSKRQAMVRQALRQGQVAVGPLLQHHRAGHADASHVTAKKTSGTRWFKGQVCHMPMPKGRCSIGATPSQGCAVALVQMSRSRWICWKGTGGSPRGR